MSKLSVKATTLVHKNNSLPAQIGDGKSEKAAQFQEKLSFLPPKHGQYLTEMLFAGSFVSAIFLAARAALMELFPKAFIGGLIRAKPTQATQNNIVPFSQGGGDQGSSNSLNNSQSPTLISIAQKVFSGQSQFNFPVALDESFLEIPEYFAMYFMPTIASVSVLSRAIGGMLDINFEFLGQPLHEYEKHLGKEVSVGTVQTKRLKITEAKLNKLAMGKTMLTASVVALCGALEYMVPSVRDFLTKWFLGYDDFSKLLGFDDELKDPDYANPEKRAAKNIKDALAFAFTSVTALMGLTWLLSKKIENPKMGGFFRKTSKSFDLGRNFQLSNTPLAIILLVFSIPGYLNALRGKDEKLEVINRVILYSIPTIILYKQVVLNFLTYCSGLFFGLSGDLNGLFPKMKKQISEGKRDLLNWNMLSDFQYDKKSNEYSGMISKLPRLKTLKPEARKTFLRSVGMINKLPLILAPLIGMAINLFNLQKIFEMHQEEKKKLQHQFAQ
ncbi:MAG: hypothetical protein QNJ31_04235 [Candidatus Caenarcaniphilales bacterium]|nr:hypothetical protein [Candidatus Caenarcaniphilales bacterium]